MDMISIQEHRGFTLVEMLLVSAILGPVVIALLLMVDTMHAAYSKGERKADLQQSARIGLARIVRDLRAAGYDPSGLTPGLPIQAAIQSAEASRIAFIGDTNGDGSTEKIEYRLDLLADRPVLRRQQWSTWTSGWSGTNGAQPLVEGISALEFTYYGADGAVIPQSAFPSRLSEIRRVSIVIAATTPAGQMAPETYHLVSDVRIRNAGL